MGSCKLLMIASFLFFGGVCGELRFQRHLMNTTATTQNGSKQGMSGLNLNGELVSDNDGNDVVLDKPGTIDVELTSDDDLQFEICSAGCLDKTVSVCYEADGETNNGAKLECHGFNECGFKAGVITVGGETYMWFMVQTSKTLASTYARATMKYPTTETQLTHAAVTIDSCNPVKRDGKIITLHVRDATTECSLKVINAKRWFPTTTAAPTTALPPLLTPVSSSNTTESSTSNADSTWWIVGGILAGFLILLIIGVIIGYCIYQHHQKKKAAAAKEKADRKLRVISPESLPTLDLSPYVQKEEQKPKKEEVKKEKTEKKKKQKKVEAAPAPTKVLPSKEGTTEDQPTIQPSKEKAAAKVKQVQKEKKATPAKEDSKKVNKHAQKEDVAVAAPPPPPRREGSKKAHKVVQKDVVAAPPPRQKSPTPKQRTVDTTQEETPSLERPQAAFEDGSSSPSIEKKAPKTPAKKPPQPRPSSLRRSSNKAPRHHRYPWRMNSEEWKNYQEQLRLYPRSKVIEWNSKSSSNHR